MAKNIFQFSSPDLINLRKWLKKAPREFTRAGTNVINTTAFSARKQAIKNIEAGTTTRSKPFVKRSMRVDKAPHGRPLNQVVAEMGSIDISRKGRSDGFASLETGKRSKSNRVPTLASRGGQERKKVAGKVRMDKLSKAFKFRQFRGKGIKSKQQRMVVMLKAIRKGAIGRDAFVVPSGLTGRMSGMVPGMWSMGNRKRLLLGNPFDGKRGNSKRIKWNERAADEVSTKAVLMREWKKEVNFILKRRR